VPDDQVGHGLRGRRVREGADVCLLAVGKMLAAAIEAADALAGEGVEATVWDVRCVKPLDTEMLADAGRHRLVVTLEDGVREGGAGAAIVDRLASSALDAGERAPAVKVLGTPIEYIPHGKPDEILAELGLDGAGVAATVRTALDVLGKNS
jgi:1-deoxy-D-xylulose-5-phosphate synthase